MVPEAHRSPLTKCTMPGRSVAVPAVIPVHCLPATSRCGGRSRRAFHLGAALMPGCGVAGLGLLPANPMPAMPRLTHTRVGAVAELSPAVSLPPSFTCAGGRRRLGVRTVPAPGFTSTPSGRHDFGARHLHARRGLTHRGRAASRVRPMTSLPAPTHGVDA